MSGYRTERKPLCPYCGYEIQDPNEIFDDLECVTETDCGSCEQSFTISRAVVFYYSASAEGGDL